MAIRNQQIRLSPSGPPWGGELGQPPTQGPGTPGLVFHGRLPGNVNMTGAPVAPLWDTVGPTPVIPLPWFLKRNFFYEIILDMVFTLPNTPAGNLTISITGEDTDNIEQTIVSSSDIVLPDNTETWPARFARMNLDATGWATDRDNIRVYFTGDAAAVLLGGVTNFVVTQFVP